MDTDILAVIDTAKTATGPVKLYEGPEFAKVYIPGHGAIAGKIESVDLSTTLPKPARKRGVITVFDAASFNQVIADNSDAGDISIYIDRDVTNPAVVAILNGNGKNGPGWSDMRVKIAFRKTPQWVKWQAIDGKMLPQVDFAEFVENNLEDIADPPKADFLEIVTYLQATRSVDFKSGIRLSSGAVQFQNLESLDAKVGAGQIAVPETFTLGIAPLFGIPPYRVPVRFRYRLSEGKLSLGIKLQRVEDMMRQILEDIIAKIERGANVSVLDGLPPA